MDLHPFLAAALGGALLGIAGVILLVFNGRILGISGIVNGAIKPSSDGLWRWPIVLGLIAGGTVYFVLEPGAFEVAIDRSVAACAAAGLLVGIGTQFGSGCTSGHGICGIGRFSKRSVAATITFMLTGALSVWVVEHLLTGGL